MDIIVHNHYTHDSSLDSKINLIIKNQEIMSDELQKLTDEVAETKTVAASAVTLIKGLAQQIRDGAGDKAAMLALADSLDADNKELATAVTENTPAAPTE